MILCEKCRQVADKAERLPPPWFDHDLHLVAAQATRPMVWRVLEILYRRRPTPVSVESLMTLLYAGLPDDPPDDNIIAVYISQVREALIPTPYSIKTITMIGYQFVDYKWMSKGDIGPIEQSVPPPLPIRRNWRDKYKMKEMRPGQSRVVENQSLNTLRASCAAATRRGWGKFTAGLDAEGAMRIWMLE